jgi:hypothetical protein
LSEHESKVSSYSTDVDDSCSNSEKKSNHRREQT